MKEGYINKINVVKKGMVWKIYGVSSYVFLGGVKDNGYVGKIYYDTVAKKALFIKAFHVVSMCHNKLSQITKTMKEYSIEVLGKETEC